MDERFGCKTGRYIDRGPFGIKIAKPCFAGKKNTKVNFFSAKHGFFYVGKRNWTNGCIKILKKFYIKHTQKRAF